MSQDYENRDMRCAADVGRMARLGRFDVEFHVFGSAVYQPDDGIYYYATGDEKKLYDYIRQQRLQEWYFTPVAQLSRRSKVPAGMKAQLMQDTKHMLLKQMKQDYEASSYFKLMQPFFAVMANDHALPILEAYRERIDGHFDDTELQLFLGAMWMALEGKVLTVSSYQQLKSWYDRIRRQMADDPVVADHLSRTFYGFVYESADGSRGSLLDAEEMTVVHRRQEMLRQGALAAPILQKTYWFQQSSQIGEMRQQYKNWLQKSQSAEYMQLLRQITTLPGVVDDNEMKMATEQLAEFPAAKQAAEYYAALWNRKQKL